MSASWARSASPTSGGASGSASGSGVVSGEWMCRTCNHFVDRKDVVVTSDGLFHKSDDGPVAIFVMNVLGSNKSVLFSATCIGYKGMPEEIERPKEASKTADFKKEKEHLVDEKKKKVAPPKK